MKSQQLNRNKLLLKPLKSRKNKVVFERDLIECDFEPNINTIQKKELDKIIEKIKIARSKNKAVMLSFGAHAIKNCLAKIFINLINEGWVTHLATNGAGVIHDWEIAYQGKTSEDVKQNVANGEFGAWQETGYYINLALNVGAFEGLGYGESIGKMISNDGLVIPAVKELEQVSTDLKYSLKKRAAALDLLEVIKSHNIKTGKIKIEHKYKQYSVQKAAYEKGINFTSHPMIGHDIIYIHPLSRSSAIGRCADKDFLTFAKQVENLNEGGVYMSIGSAIMSPMVFEKSMSMVQNLYLQKKQKLKNYDIVVVDLAKNNWDWKMGEPPVDNPSYYLRYCKSFSRMGGCMTYLQMDNRDFLLNIYQSLTGASI